jgi:hypothetical protein
MSAIGIGLSRDSMPSMAVSTNNYSNCDARRTKKRDLPLTIKKNVIILDYVQNPYPFQFDQENSKTGHD